MPSNEVDAVTHAKTLSESSFVLLIQINSHPSFLKLYHKHTFGKK